MSDCTGSFDFFPENTPNGHPERDQRLHRIQEVRVQQEVSLRSAARHMNVSIPQLRVQEQDQSDLRISDLHCWQSALDVPLRELLEESEGMLADGVQQRARMVRLMKTAAAMRDQAPSAEIRQLAEQLVEQLVEIMPELKDVGPWHEYGQRRSTRDYGRVVERQVSEDLFQGRMLD